MNAATIGVGSYVALPGGTPGRIVDRITAQGITWYLVKLTKNGNIVRVAPDKLTAR